MEEKENNTDQGASAFSVPNEIVHFFRNYFMGDKTDPEVMLRAELLSEFLVSERFWDMIADWLLIIVYIVAEYICYKEDFYLDGLYDVKFILNASIVAGSLESLFP